MSFSQRIQGNRGHKLVGPLLATVALLVLTLFYLIAFGEYRPWMIMKLRKEITANQGEIAILRTKIAQSQQKREQRIGQLAVADEHAQLTKELARRTAELADQTRLAGKLREDLQQNAARFQAHRDQYRRAVRRAAKGLQMDRLETKTGRSYENVVITEVSAVGMQIRHPNGLTRIPYEELPDELQRKYQFSPDEKQGEIASEITAHSQHEKAVEANQTEIQERAREKAAREQAVKREALTRRLEVQHDLIREAERDLRALQRELSTNQRRKFRNTEAIETKIGEKQAQLNRLEAERASIELELETTP